MEELNTLYDGVQTEVVDGQEELSPEDTAEITADEKEQQAEQQTVTEPVQSAQENKAFAAMRRKIEEQERINQQAIEQLTHFLGVAGVTPASTDPMDILLTAQSYKTGVPLNKLKEQQTEQSKVEAMKQELLGYRKMNMESVMNTDLLEIQSLDPQIKSIDDLGEQFLTLRLSGVDNLTAYHAVKSALVKKTATQMGDIKASEPAEKDFYTREEVAAMSQSEVNSKLDKIKKSMTKWR